MILITLKSDSNKFCLNLKNKIFPDLAIMFDLKSSINILLLKQ